MNIQDATILYVEDDNETREQFSRILGRRVGKVLLADNGKEGLERFHQKIPDVIVTDLEMPVMNGVEMVRAIREENGKQPVVVLTAFADEYDDVKDVADAVLVKPIDKHKLLETLTKLLETL